MIIITIHSVNIKFGPGHGVFYIKCQHVIYQFYREFYVEYDDIN